MPIRDFIIRTLIEDLASGKLEKIISQAHSLAEKPFQMALKASTADAERGLAAVAKQGKAVSSIDLTQATHGLQGHRNAVDLLKTSYGALTQQASQAQEAAGNFFSRISAGQLAIAGATAGVAAFGKNALDVYSTHSRNVDLIKEKLGGQAGGLMEFIEKGGQQAGTSKTGRADFSNYLVQAGYKDAERIQGLVESSEKVMHSKFGRNLKNIGINSEQDLFKAISGGVSETSEIGMMLKQEMPEFFRAGMLQAEKQKLRLDPRYAYQSEEVVDAEAKKRLAERAITKISGGLEIDDSLSGQIADFHEKFNDLSLDVAKKLAPAAETVMKFVNTVISLAQKAPLLTAVGATVAALAIGLGGLAAVLPLVSSGLEMMNASMLLNPYVLAAAAIAALVVGLVALESKTQIVSKAWDHFAKSEIGKDLIEGVKGILDSLGMLGDGGDLLGGLGSAIEKISGWVGDLFDQFDAVYKMVKGGDILGALKGSLSLAMKISPVGIVAGMVEGFLPSKRVLDFIAYILQKIQILWEGLAHWFGEIWDSITLLLDPLIKVKEWIQKLVEKLGGGEGLSGSKLKEALKAEMEKGGTYFHHMTPEQIELLSRYASGDKSITGEMLSEAGITGPQMREAKRIADDLRNPPSALPSLMPSSVTKGIESRDAAIADVASEVEPALNEAIEKKDPLAYLKGVLGGYAKLGGALLHGEGSAKGGDVTKTGWELVHEGEPIVPAEVARSSVLIDRLRDVAQGGSTAASGAGSVSITNNISVNASDGADGRRIGEQIAEVLERKLDDATFKARVESVVHRASRSYIA